jgi:threonine dehydrogenase-like Zn-dependent dehydrogenase
LTILTVFGAPPRAWDLAVTAMARGDLDTGVLVTHEMSLADVADAFQLLDNPPHGLGKILLRP